MEDKDNEIIVSTHDTFSSSDIVQLIDKKDIANLRTFIMEHKAVDIAQVLEDMSLRNILFIFKTVKSEYTAEIFSYLENDLQQDIANGLSDEEVHDLVDELSTDDLVDFVEDLPANLVKKILQTTNRNDLNRRVTINAFLRFKKDSAGSIMTTEFVELKAGMKASDALKRIREVGRDAETISSLFVIDSSRHLVGVLYLDELIFSNEDTIIDEIMNDDFLSVTTEDDREDVATLFKKYDIQVMPVVNKEQRLVGIITIDDIMDVIEDETTEDIQKMAGTTPVTTPYLKTSILKLASSRIVWLLVLMVSATLTGLIISKFEFLIAAIPVLSSFIPMLMDTSGNAGNQSTTTITRALAVGDIGIKDYWHVALKEVAVGLLTGLVIALFNFAWILVELNIGIIKNTSTVASWLIALQVSLTLYIIIVLAKFLGASLPMLGKLIHVDPALMAGPLITTILDTISLILYFILAKAIIPGL
ncbi:MAG TPA: magnesium transporter [Firmicutes bacterium]|nr:magnesium transporter [Bacillota bacterium]